MKKFLSVLLAILLFIPILPLSTNSLIVSAADGRDITVNKTGIYSVNIASNYTGGISLLDQNGGEVSYYEKLGGYPLIKGLKYKLDIPTTISVEIKLVCETIFPDTDKNGWYNDAVTYVVGAGLMSGYSSNGKFGTSDSIQRQDFLVILARYEGVNLTNYQYKSVFPDVAANSYYEAAVNWGVESNIVNGYDNGKFGVGDKVTREQIVTFFARYAKYKGINTSYNNTQKNNVKNTYSDYNGISSFSRDAVIWAVSKGVISGKTVSGKTLIAPQGSAERCEVAKIMYNIFANEIFTDSDSLSGTTIIFASTIDPRDDGTDYVVSQFQREYGIDVKVIVPTLENYNAEISNLIASGKAPTVGRSAGDAPIYVGYFDSLDKAKIDYSDPIWDQRMFKLSTYNGSPYLCNTINNFWTEMDIVVYSKSLLKKANVPTPEELDKVGKWTLDSYLIIGQKTAQLEGCYGATFANFDTLLNMSGGAVYRTDSNNYMVNGIDENTAEICKKISTAFTIDKSLISGGASRIITGEAAISTTSMWSLRTDGNFISHPNWNDLGFYFLPSVEEGGKRYVTGQLRGWGIMKGCNENPETGSKAAEAGGLFLREYLDVNNYDLSRSFISEEAKEFFFKACNEYIETDNYNPYYTTYNLNEGISGIDDDKVVYVAMYSQPNQIDLLIKSAKSAVDKACKNLNDYINLQTNNR